MNKQDRFHKDIYFPDSWEESFDAFKEGIYANGPLTFSAHGVYKLVDYVGEYGKYILKFLQNLLVAGPIEKENVFEFYTQHKSTEIIKMCLRYNIPNFPTDCVLVISNTCVIITIYMVDKDKTHQFLNKNLYIRKRGKNVSGT